MTVTMVIKSNDIEEKKKQQNCNAVRYTNHKIGKFRPIFKISSKWRQIFFKEANFL